MDFRNSTTGIARIKTPVFLCFVIVSDCIFIPLLAADDNSRTWDKIGHVIKMTLIKKSVEAKTLKPRTQRLIFYG